MINRQLVFLVVDSRESVRKVTVQQLETLGVDKVVTAGNGFEALGILQRQKIDVILSEWNMPVMGGLELLKSVRADERLSGIPFVLITAEAHRERVAEAIATGVSDLLVKPYSTAGLAARIEKALSRSARKAAPRSDAAAEPAPGLPANPDSAEKPAASPAIRKGDRPTILVVDDTPDNLQLLSHLFKDNYRVKTVLDGEKALDICGSDNPPDLVLLDVMMPGMDGFTVLEKMREHPNSQHIPVIFVTAMTADEARIRGLELGAVDFVTKPIDPQVIKARVRNFLRYVELHKQLQADYDGMMEAARLREDVEQITRHDITGPLGSVISLVQSLVDDKSLNPAVAEQLRMVESSALHVLDMVNRSSELYKIETGKFQLNPQPVKLLDTLRRVVELMESRFAAKQLTIAIDQDPGGGAEITAKGDLMLCYSIIHNLLKNACEAAPEKSRVSVSLADRDPVSLVIRNKGAVPADIRDRFFEKYVTKGKQGGSGLGTYSAKTLTEVQGGTIALQVSDGDDETAVTVTLPRSSG